MEIFFAAFISPLLLMFCRTVDLLSSMRTGTGMPSAILREQMALQTATCFLLSSIASELADTTGFPLQCPHSASKLVVSHEVTLYGHPGTAG